MGENSKLEIKIREERVINVEQLSSFENFVGQFQILCDKLLCIVDGTSLRFYDRRESIPTNIRFDYKQRKKNLTEYYFRDIDNDSLYCVFGREAAKIFYPRIDEVDVASYNVDTDCMNVITMYEGKENKKDTIITKN